MSEDNYSYKIGDLVEYATISSGNVLGKVVGFIPERGLDGRMAVVRVTSRRIPAYPLGHILELPIDFLWLRKRSR